MTEQTEGSERRLRDLFLRPDYDPNRVKPDFKNMNRAQRRRAKVEWDRDGGRFRTWVYAVTLLVLVGGFALIMAFG